ncbi:MAG: Thymidylate kinase [Myxococcota bacterium]|nr:Thymidylate kinase [Myxococcota bacterium]
MSAAARKKKSVRADRNRKKAAELLENDLDLTFAKRFFDTPLPGHAPEEWTGKLIVVEGSDGSGRSTHIALLKEWLESQGFAVETMGLRRSNLIARDLDEILAHNVVTSRTLALLYATDLYDQLENRIIPALRAGLIVLADRYFFSLVARAAVRGIARGYLEKIYGMTIRPDMTFRLKVPPQIAFEREFRKNQMISFWESGRDMHLSDSLYESFVSYQSKIAGELDVLSKKYGFIEISAEGSIPRVNEALRRHVAEHLGIRSTKFTPSSALIHLWR